MLGTTNLSFTHSENVIKDFFKVENTHSALLPEGLIPEGPVPEEWCADSCEGRGIFLSVTRMMDFPTNIGVTRGTLLVAILVEVSDRAAIWIAVRFFSS